MQTVQILIIASVTLSSIICGAHGACFNLLNSCENGVKVSQFCADNCDANGKCTAQAGNNFPVSIVFSSDKPVSSVQVNVKAGMFFQLLNEDACVTKDLTCPIQANTDVTYKKLVEVPSIAPAGTFDIAINAAFDGVKKVCYTLKSVVVSK